MTPQSEQQLRQHFYIFQDGSSLMIGQEKLLAQIDAYISSETLPRTLLFEGEWGCGKHTLAQEVGAKLKVEVQDITATLNLETIEQIMLSPIPRVYVIDASRISIKEQNVILKFLEEPLKNSYIVLLVENKNKLLNTVVNRCVCLSFEQYTDAELEQFVYEGKYNWCLTSTEKYARTPGRIVQFHQHSIEAMLTFIEKIFLQIGVANYSNILTIPNKIAFKDESDLYEFNVFIYLLVNKATDMYAEGKIPYSAFSLTADFYNDCYIPHINKQHLFEHYLIELKQLFERGI